MEKGFIFSIDAMFGIAIIIVISGISVAQLELASQSNPYTPLNLGANDEAIVGLYLNNTTGMTSGGQAYACDYYYVYSDNGGGLGSQGSSSPIQKCVAKT